MRDDTHPDDSPYVSAPPLAEAGIGSGKSRRPRIVAVTDQKGGGAKGSAATGKLADGAPEAPNGSPGQRSKKSKSSDPKRAAQRARRRIGQTAKFARDERAERVTPGMRAAVLMFTVGVMLVLLAGTGLLIYREREAQWTRAEDRVLSVTLALAELTKGMVQGTTTPLNHLADEISSGTSPRQAAQTMLQDNGFFSGALVVAGDGRILASTTPAFKPGTSAFGPLHRDYWNRSMAENGRPLPTVIQPADGAPGQFALVRPIAGAGVGRTIGGLVVGLIADDPFLALLGAADLGPGGRFSLYDRSGTLLARYPDAGDLLGRSYTKAPLFSEVLPNRPSGATEITEPGGTGARVVGHRLVDSPRLVLTTGISTTEAYAPWHEALPIFSTIIGIIVASIAVLVTLILRQVSLADRARGQLSDGQDRFQTFFNAAYEGQVVLKGDKITDVNPAAAAMIGRDPDQLVDRSFLELVAESDRVLVEAKLRQDPLGGPPPPLTVGLRRADRTAAPAELRVRVLPAGNGERTRIVALQDIAERLRIEDGLRRLSAYDALTECYNRRAFLAIAEGEFDRFQRHGRALSLMMIDADHIRQINESHGHLAGDDILRHLVHRCGLIMRISDLIGRFGGEEFAILLPETAMAGVERTAERLRADVAREPLKSGGTKVHYTVSIGVAEARAADKTLDDLLRRAESALAMAKISGRNQVRRAA